jgi:deoxyribose-phosphate aldolase
MTTVKVSIPQIAKLIDHSLLQPTMTDEEILKGLKTARDLGTATACVKPYSIPVAKDVLSGSGVGICPVIGFPHGNSTTKVKVFEAVEAAKEGGSEIDMVVNVGKVLGGQWDYVEQEIKEINEAVVEQGAILKVIFETDFLQNEHIIKLCEICTRVKVAFVKTSTGYGYVKVADGNYNYKGATLEHLRLMKQHCGPDIQIKASGGVRNLDQVLQVIALGVNRIGASATESILAEARARGIGNEPVEVKVELA